MSFTLSRTRVFAVPLGGSKFYEFDALSFSGLPVGYGPEYRGTIEIEVSAKDRKYVKRMSAAGVFLKFGVRLPNGERFVFHGFIAAFRRDRLNDTVLAEIDLIDSIVRLPKEDEC